MKLIDRCCDRLSAALARPSRRDGRWVILFSLAGYGLILAALAGLVGIVSAWQTLGVWAMWPPFADTRGILAGMDSQRLGCDPLQENPCDPWHRPTNYPRLWLWPAALGLGQKDTAAIGLGVIAAFYACLFLWAGRINFARGVIFALAVCSPALMFGVERANNDLLLFVLLAGAVTLVRRFPVMRPLLYAAVLFASLLKFYPAAGVLVVAREKLGRALAWGLGLVGVFAAYVLLTLRDVRFISAATDRLLEMSYGRMVLFGLGNFALYRVSGLVLSERVVLVASFVGVGVALLLAYLWARGVRGTPVSADHLDSFLLGSGVYAGSFLVGNGCNYRLVFLLLLLPQLCDWIAQRGRLARPAFVVLVAVLLSIWGEYPLRLVSAPAALTLQQVATWVVFGGALALVMVALPQWVRSWLRLGAAKESDSAVPALVAPGAHR